MSLWWFLSVCVHLRCCRWWHYFAWTLWMHCSSRGLTSVCIFWFLLHICSFFHGEWLYLPCYQPICCLMVVTAVCEGIHCRTRKDKLRIDLLRSYAATKDSGSIDDLGMRSRFLITTLPVQAANMLFDGRYCRVWRHTLSNKKGWIMYWLIERLRCK